MDIDMDMDMDLDTYIKLNMDMDIRAVHYFRYPFKFPLSANQLNNAYLSFLKCQRNGITPFLIDIYNSAEDLF
jgi:hypothetical protein